MISIAHKTLPAYTLNEIMIFQTLYGRLAYDVSFSLHDNPVK